MALIETKALRHSYRDGAAFVWAVDGVDLAQLEQNRHSNIDKSIA